MDAKTDSNNTKTLLWVSAADWVTPVPIAVDPVTWGVLITLA